MTLPDGTKIPAVAAVLRASQGNNNLNILSSPNLLTQNNKEAEIIVAENIPFITSQVRDSTNLANVINTVERKDVGITLRITPHIHESEFVSLDIYQEASALKPDALSLAQTDHRRADLDETVREDHRPGEERGHGDPGRHHPGKPHQEHEQDPLLGDIPLLGWLFRFSSEQKTRTNL